MLDVTNSVSDLDVRWRFMNHGIRKFHLFTTYPDNFSFGLVRRHLMSVQAFKITRFEYYKDNRENKSEKGK